jgi:hypothetical protein
MLKMISSQPLRFIGVAVALMGVFIAATPPLRVAAYGTDHLFELTLSYNCRNASICPATPFGIGGLWGWLEPDTDLNVDGSLQFEGHQNADPNLDGSAHSESFLPWSVISCTGPTPPAACALIGPGLSPTDPNGQYFDILTNFLFTDGRKVGPIPILVPATPGHYHVQSAPGVTSNATVTALT